VAVLNQTDHKAIEVENTTAITVVLDLDTR